MRIFIGVMVVLFFSVMIIGAGHAAKPPQAGLKHVDMDKDGTPELRYYHDGTHIQKVEADTNGDGEKDITVRRRKGEFESAQVDTNFDGTPDKTFTDAAEFNKWLNENHPRFNDAMNAGDLSTVAALKF